jgi:hypothetical protein
MGGGACSLSPLAFRDDSFYQYTAEFIGAILVIREASTRLQGYQDKAAERQHGGPSVGTRGELPQRSPS